MESTVDKLDIQVEPLARDTLQQRVYDQVAGLILDGDSAMVGLAPFAPERLPPLDPSELTTG